MRVLVKRGYAVVNELSFDKGPVYIGRLPRSQVYLPSTAVSRQHAVFLMTSNGSWIIQDLESANKTTVNGDPVARHALKDGDLIGVADYSLEIRLDSDSDGEHLPLDLGDTLVNGHERHEAVMGITRRRNHVICIGPKRLSDFYELTVSLCSHGDQESMLDELSNVLLGQFNAFHVWTGLRETTSGPLTSYGGRANDGKQVALEELLGKKIVKQAIKDENHILMPNVADAFSAADSQAPSLHRLRSAMSAPVVGPSGAYGVIYVDNALDQPMFTLEDLDYLTLVSTQVGALAEHIA